MTDIPHECRSPMEHERDAGDDLLADADAKLAQNEIELLGCYDVHPEPYENDPEAPEARRAFLENLLAPFLARIRELEAQRNEAALLLDLHMARADTAEAEVASLRAQIDAKDADLKHAMDSNKALVAEVDRLKREASPAPSPGVWHQGEPPKPWRQEWFIAQTIHRDRVVLCALPEEYTYDYMTADHTYMIAGNITRWMQFPDSEFIAPTPSRDDVLEEAARVADAKAAAIEQDEQERLTWGGPDPRGSDARKNMLESAANLRLVAAAIRAMKETGE